MATIYSDQLVKSRAGRNINANEWLGRVRVISWDFASLPAGSIGDILVCGRLPAGHRVLQGREFHTALSSGGGTATGSYGTYGLAADGVSLGAVVDVDAFLAATSLEAAGQNDLATLQASTQGVYVGPLLVATVDLLICLTNSVEAFATAGRVSGFIITVGD